MSDADLRALEREAKIDPTRLDVFARARARTHGVRAVHWAHTVTLILREHGMNIALVQSRPDPEARAAGKLLGYTAWPVGNLGMRDYREERRQVEDAVRDIQADPNLADCWVHVYEERGEPRRVFGKTVTPVRFTIAVLF